MFIRQLTLSVLVLSYLGTVYAHPKHQHKHTVSNPESLNNQTHLNNHYNDTVRNQIVTVLLEKAYARGDGDLLEQAENLMKTSKNPSDVENKLLATRLAQANHDFSTAEKTLKEILKSQPNQYDAILQLANIYRLQGQFDQSLSLCNQLSDSEVKWYQAGCILQVEAMTKSYSDLKPKADELLKETSRLSKNDKQWFGNILLEVATRFNDQQLATQAIPLLATDNLPNTLAKANWYIAQQQYQTAITILEPYRYHDGALYRIILAKQKLADSSSNQDLSELSLRVQTLLKQQDHIHLREQAQYLWISKQYQEGLKIAAKNWDMQRENEDFEVYAALAIESKNQNSAEKLLNWSKKTGYQNPMLVPELEKLVTKL
ncbi:tetratricopeptide repeat protein [Acinetobacter beijerinckii]|uniref:tetratricopeptide repeat protein n=1 Tax=Acinetobacter beijerinckii TaxID=262668 RepID=UPI003009EAC5